MKNETDADKNQNKAKQLRDDWPIKKNDNINQMSEEELILALKSKGLPTFGTRSERTERLKKHFGLKLQENN